MPLADRALTDALRRQKKVVSRPGSREVVKPELDGLQPILPADDFLEAAQHQLGHCLA